MWPHAVKRYGCVSVVWIAAADRHILNPEHKTQVTVQAINRLQGEQENMTRAVAAALHATRPAEGGGRAGSQGRKPVQPVDPWK